MSADRAGDGGTGEQAPKRIQLSRAKGWRKPSNAIVVSRPSRWGNPWRVTDLGEQPWSPSDGRPRYRVHHVTEDAGMGTFNLIETARSTATSQFRSDLVNGRLPYTVEDVQRELAGHDLCCWCPATPLNPNGSLNWLGLRCHAEVLLEFANVTD